MEAEKGNAVRFVHPVAGFVAKTSVVAAGEGGAGSQEGATKVFLNLCTSPEIAEATMSASPKGQQWQIPYSLSQERKDTDKGGGEARVLRLRRGGLDLCCCRCCCCWETSPGLTHPPTTTTHNAPTHPSGEGVPRL